MKISIIGTGYVGLTTGTCLAEAGNDVLCVDIDEKKIENLKKGIIPIYEPGLEELVKKNIESGNLSFTTDTKKAVEHADVIFSAVGTPPDKDYKADLSFVKEVASAFGKYADEYKIFVNKSTVPVGTGNVCKEIIQKEFEKRMVTFGFDMISNPEFLKEGSAIDDTMMPDRIIIGYESEKAKDKMLEVYTPIIKQSDAEVVCCDIPSAEIIKYASNAFLATKITFINEIANFCEAAGGGNVELIAKGMGLDKRIGKYFLKAGIGYGGSCFPKDVKALIQTGKEHNYNFKVIKTVEEVNEQQKTLLFRKLKETIKDVKGKKIALWGLSFKPNTDDMRDAPSLTIIKELLQEGAEVIGYDPVAEEAAQRYFSNLYVGDDKYGILEDADALLILTEWSEFETADLSRVKKLMKGSVILDGRNVFKKDAVIKAGFNYYSIGR